MAAGPAVLFHTWHGPAHRDSSGYWAPLEVSYQLLTPEGESLLQKDFAQDSLPPPVGSSGMPHNPRAFPGRVILKEFGLFQVQVYPINSRDCWSVTVLQTWIDN